MGDVVARRALVGGLAACLLAMPATASAGGRTAAPGAAAAGCLAHLVGNPDEDFYEHYTRGCTGHDGPELDPVSSAPCSARAVPWLGGLPSGGTLPGARRSPT